MDIVEKIQPIRNYLLGIHSDLQARGDAPEIPITFLPTLNAKIWGLKKKTLVVVGSRTSQGKTSFLTQLAFKLAERNIPVLYLSLEETPDTLIERIFCQEMEVDNFCLISGQFKKELSIQAKWKTFVEVVSKIPLLVTCGVGKNWNEVNQTISLISPKPKVVIVDYIQAIALRPRDSREMINEYIRQFRQGAVEGNYVGILASQINRGAESNANNKPAMWQLKDTGVLEEHSDLVLLLFWEYFYKNDEEKMNDFMIQVAKNKRGRTGEIFVKYYPEFYKFSER